MKPGAILGAGAVVAAAAALLLLSRPFGGDEASLGTGAGAGSPGDGELEGGGGAASGRRPPVPANPGAPATDRGAARGAGGAASAGMIRGVVRSPSGDPVPGAEVVVTVHGKAGARTAAGTTRSDGSFEVARPAAGEAAVHVRAPGLPGISRTVPSGEDGAGAGWDLPRPAKISGVVRDPAGMPAVGIRVLAKPADGAVDVGQAETGADGTYELGGLEQGRRYDVRTWSPLHAPAGPLAVTPPAVGVDFNLDPGGTLVIEVLTADGKPAPPMPQAAPGTAAPIHSFATLSGDQGYGTTTTNWTTQEGGKLTFRALPAGRYTVRAQVRGHGDARMDGISVPRSGEIRVSLLLGRGGFATIEVRGKDGTMLAGATVLPEKEADTPFGMLVSGTTDQAGRASVGPLPTGLQALLVRADGHEPARVTVQVSDGITVPAPEVRLAGRTP